ncbi:hypothetical protein ABW21_db0203045 [Orbilia brochopaga]|nr:hypothetical protein ABW21_db0203045 [Drechslerella brochopaga]
MLLSQKILSCLTFVLVWASLNVEGRVCRGPLHANSPLEHESTTDVTKVTQVANIDHEGSIDGSVSVYRDTARRSDPSASPGSTCKLEARSKIEARAKRKKVPNSGPSNDPQNVGGPGDILGNGGRESFKRQKQEDARLLRQVSEFQSLDPQSSGSSREAPVGGDDSMDVDADGEENPMRDDSEADVSVDRPYGYIDEFEQLDPDQDEELWTVAMERARSQAVRMSDGSAEKLQADLRLTFPDAQMHPHPIQAILKALELRDPDFHPEQKTIREVRMGSALRDQLILSVGVSEPQKHLVVPYHPRIWDPRQLERYLYMCWRVVGLSSIAASAAGALYSDVAGSLPQAPGSLLRYISFIYITDQKTVALLNRLAVYGGGRLKNYKDPEKNSQRTAFSFNFDLLLKHDEDSAQRRTANGVLGLTEVFAVKLMLAAHFDGLHWSTIRNVYVVLDYGAKPPCAHILIELESHDRSVPKPAYLQDQNLLTYELDSMDLRAASDFDPRLASKRKDDPEYAHPLDIDTGEEVPAPEQTYYSTEMAYWLGRQKGLQVNVLSSIENEHLIVVGPLTHWEPQYWPLLAHVLIEGWVDEFGHKAVHAITFLTVTPACASYAHSKIADASDGKYSVRWETDPAAFDATLNELLVLENQTIEMHTLFRLIHAGFFARQTLSEIQMIRNPQYDYSIVVIMTRNWPWQPRRDDSVPPGNDATQEALQRGIDMGSQLEQGEFSYLEDMPATEIALKGINENLRVTFLDADIAIARRNGDFNMFQELSDPNFNFNGQTHPFNDPSGLLDQLTTWAGTPDPSLDPMERYWQGRFEAEFTQANNQNSYRSIALTYTGAYDKETDAPSEDVGMTDDAPPSLNARIFKLAVSQLVGNVIVETKFPELDDMQDHYEGDDDVDNMYEGLIWPDLSAAVWSIWLSADKAAPPNPQLKSLAQKGFAGLRYVTILRPSDETIQILQDIYSRNNFDKSRIRCFPHRNSGFDPIADAPSENESLRRRLALTLSGLVESLAIDGRCEKNIKSSYSVLNYKKRIGAVIVRWDNDQPQLVLALTTTSILPETQALADSVPWASNFAFFLDRNVRTVAPSFGMLRSFRQRPEFSGIFQAGSLIALANSFIPDLARLVEGPYGEITDDFEGTRGDDLETCPEEIRGFFADYPWKTFLDNPRKAFTKQDQVDTTRLGSQQPLNYKTYLYRHIWSDTKGPPYRPSSGNKRTAAKPGLV